MAGNKVLLNFRTPALRRSKILLESNYLRSFMLSETNPTFIKGQKKNSRESGGEDGGGPIFFASV